ncbi:MAG: hypothetical protein HY288_12055 [Planctomycetia bacterium]|nr:hypothetical protein [Planctomycetia bacterium]
MKFDSQTADDSQAPLSSGDSGPESPDASTVITPAAPATSFSGVELSSELQALREKVRQVLTLYYPRHQNTRDNSPWEVIHAIIAYGVDTQLFKGGPGGEKVNAVGWMCYNHPCAGDQILFVNHGKIDARRGPGVQGHFGQFLAILAQSHVKIDYPMQVNGKKFTLADLVEHEKENCVPGEELTFKLIALMHYLDSDATWTTRDGQEWSLQRLVREELKQPIRGAACGGTHRLMGFSYAVNKRTQRGKPIIGEFQRAQAFLQDYHGYTFSLQNPDGSFSTEWFTRRGDSPDIDRRLKTSGHILEWISFSLSDQELRDPRMLKAVDYVATLLLKNSKHIWEIGPLGHGLHALSIYDTRVFKGAEVQPPQNVVDRPQDTSVPPFEARQVGGSSE